ncbi:unnamed protein product [Thlaspi arvense]|uniref:Uncharacterized protein n=1 Tax=Thlaspi arvense TaxID=13288 RepID=A0AAU9TAY5_THLAR|nr:unnamed protein product [Thlaspi arvense]
MRFEASSFGSEQTLGDRNLRKLAFSHIVQTIRKMTSITEPRHKSLEKIVISMLEQEDETKAKRAQEKGLAWIMISSLGILLDDDDDSESKHPRL